MTEKKYEFTGETQILERYGIKTTLHRIRALKDFGDVKKGDLGGWIEEESNLSHEGNCWLFDESKIYKQSYASGSVVLRHGSEAYEKVNLSGNVKLSYFTKVYDNVILSGDVKMSHSVAHNNVILSGDVKMGSSYVKNNVILSGKVKMKSSHAETNIVLYGELDFIGKFVLGENQAMKDAKDFPDIENLSVFLKN